MTDSPVWLGIDPGLAIIGWAILKELPTGEASLIDYGTIETSKKVPTARRLFEIETDLALDNSRIPTRTHGYGDAFL